MQQSDITDAYTRRTVTLLRTAEGEAIDIARRLDRVSRAIQSIIEREFVSDSRLLLDAIRIKREAGQRLDEFYSGQLPRELSQMQAEVIAKEVEWQREALATATTLEVRPLRVESVVNAAKAKAYQGHTFDFHVKKLGSTASRIIGALDRGYLDGKSVQEMTRDVSGLIGRADHDVRTVTRSFFMHNATEAKDMSFRNVPDMVEALVWVSTLDARTTPLICGIRDQKLYTVEDKQPIHHTLPWDGGPGRIHWNCRSTYAPKVRGVDAGAQPRPSVGPGDNYERGDGVTRTGRVRKPNKAAREKGIFQVEQRTTRSRYEGWLREQSKKNIDFVADVLGSKESARAFREGEVTLAELRALSPVANPQRRGQL